MEIQRDRMPCSGSQLVIGRAGTLLDVIEFSTFRMFILKQERKINCVFKY